MWIWLGRPILVAVATTIVKIVITRKFRKRK